MKNSQTNWTKEELEIYILLLCSKADSSISEEELSFIKSKVDIKSFEKIYKEFSEDSEEEAIEKIDDNVQQHHYSPREILSIRANMKSVFFTDNEFGMKEEYLDRIIDNILY